MKLKNGRELSMLDLYQHKWDLSSDARAAKVCRFALFTANAKRRSRFRSKPRSLLGRDPCDGANS